MTGALLLLTLVAPKWELTLDQTFDGPQGQAPDPAVWGRDLGPAQQNGELETYTDGNANAFLDGRGHLVIEARKEAKDGRRYTSARLKTEGRFEQRYGRMEARMMLPRGRGIWPAFWMLGGDIAKVGWPACGEIDVLENIGRAPDTVYGTLHGPGYSGGSGIQNKIDDTTLSTRFHDYAVEWSPEKIVWTFDGKPFHTVEAKSVGNKRWPFEQPFFLLLNLAVGGGFPGNPDETTTFPQRLVVDSVKVWRDASLVVDDAALAKRHADRMAAASVYRYPGASSVPGIVKLADYLPGGEGVGYHDSDDRNEGGAYRTDGVDIGASGLPEAPWAVGWTKAGEWLLYGVDVEDSADYKVGLMTTSGGEGGTIQLSVDDAPPFATVRVPDTGGWSNWKELPAGTTPLLKGRHRIKVTMKTASPGGSVGNVAFLRFTRA